MVRFMIIRKDIPSIKECIKMMGDCNYVCVSRRGKFYRFRDTSGTRSAHMRSLGFKLRELRSLVIRGS